MCNFRSMCRLHLCDALPLLQWLFILLMLLYWALEVGVMQRQVHSYHPSTKCKDADNINTVYIKCHRHTSPGECSQNNKKRLNIVMTVPQNHLIANNALSVSQRTARPGATPNSPWRTCSEPSLWSTTRKLNGSTVSDLMNPGSCSWFVNMVELELG